MTQSAQSLITLVELQRQTDALKQLHESQRVLNELQAKNREALVFFDQMLATKAERIAEAQQFISEKQQEISESEEGMRRSRAKLNTASSQRELNALNKELDLSRRTATIRSEELKKLEAGLEEARNDYNQRQKERDELASECAALEAKKQQEIAEQEAQGASSTALVEQLRKSLDRPLLSRFDRIAKAREGQAVADTTPHGTCSACNIALPPQMFNHIQSGEAVEYCPNCQRMLISFSLVEQTKAQANE